MEVTEEDEETFGAVEVPLPFITMLFCLSWGDIWFVVQLIMWCLYAELSRSKEFLHMHSPVVIHFSPPFEAHSSTYLLSCLAIDLCCGLVSYSFLSLSPSLSLSLFDSLHPAFLWYKYMKLLFFVLGHPRGRGLGTYIHHLELKMRNRQRLIVKYISWCR